LRFPEERLRQFRLRGHMVRRADLEQPCHSCKERRAGVGPEAGPERTEQDVRSRQRDENTPINGPQPASQHTDLRAQSWGNSTR
jgi:hypothetical protein